MKKKFIELHRIEHKTNDSGNAEVVFVKFFIRKNTVDEVLAPFSRTPNVLKEYDSAITIRGGGIVFKVKETYEEIMNALEEE